MGTTKRTLKGRGYRIQIPAKDPTGMTKNKLNSLIENLG